MPTALELGSKGWKPYIKAANLLPDPPHKTQHEREVREKILDRVRELASALKTRFKAQRVILFGSLAHDAWFTPDSDVDLAVEGLVGEDYWRAWGLAEKIIDDRSVDLIEIEAVGDSLRRVIERHGVEL
jgi:predicted nucleotidyltransferase